jgi:serine/threonine protein kinase
MEAASRDRELVHSDLKPENLMIDKGRIRIADFGLAHRVRVTNGAYEKIYAGSWPYAAPERFAGEPCDSRADVYSLGVILYEMLTGMLPYPFELAEDPAKAYVQLRDFHAGRGMSVVRQALGIPGDLGDVLSTFLSPWRDERGRSFRGARRLMQELGAVPATPDAEGLTTAERLARVEGLQAVGEHSTALTLLNSLLTEEPHNGALHLAAARSLDATGNSASAAKFRERALRLIRSGSP